MIDERLWLIGYMVAVLISAVVLFAALVYALSRKLKDREHTVGSFVIFSIRVPLACGIFLIALPILYSMLSELLLDDFLRENAQDIMSTLVLTWVFYIFYKSLTYIYSYKSMKTNTAPGHSDLWVSSIKILHLVMTLVYVLSLMQIYEISLTAVIAVTGAGAAALAFASKMLLQNFFGGLYILISRPFVVGNVISSPDKAIAGTVISYGWIQTLILKSDGSILSVPNSIITSIILNNSSVGCAEVVQGVQNKKSNYVLSEVIQLAKLERSELGDFIAGLNEEILSWSWVKNNRTRVAWWDSMSQDFYKIELDVEISGSHPEGLQELRQKAFEHIGAFCEKYKVQMVSYTKKEG